LTGEIIASQHGSLTKADAVVPVAFGHPSGAFDSTVDDLLLPIIESLGPPEELVDRILEAPAISCDPKEQARSREARR
jgi:hypothetical protein